MIEELKPCPFCGGEPGYRDDTISRMATIYCRACPCEMNMFYGTCRDRLSEYVVEAWNRRTGDGR